MNDFATVYESFGACLNCNMVMGIWMKRVNNPKSINNGFCFMF